MDLEIEYENALKLLKVNKEFADKEELNNNKKWFFLGVSYFMARLQEEGLEHILIDDIKMDAAIIAGKIHDNED